MHGDQLHTCYGNRSSNAYRVKAMTPYSIIKVYGTWEKVLRCDLARPTYVVFTKMKTLILKALKCFFKQSENIM